MPTPTQTRRRDPNSGTAKQAHGDQMVALFGFPGLHQLLPALDDLMDSSQPGRRGRKSPYPPLCLLAVYACARITGSLASAIKMLHSDPSLWERCVEAWDAYDGPSLPVVPPNREQVRYLRDLIVAEAKRLARLQKRFRYLAVAQAQQMGNLLPGAKPDWADPAETHSIYGDGTQIRRYSDVREVTHPLTREVVALGSRAKTPGRARIQRLSTDAAEDKKHSRGLNMVAMHTWVPGAGRIVLGTAVATGGEAWAALALIEALHDLARDGIHSVIYDRALTGWHAECLMAQRRIQVIGKAVGANAEQSAWDGEHRDTDQEVKDAIDRRLAERDPATTAKANASDTADLTHLLRRDVLSDMLRYHDRLPLGLCLYPTSKRNFDLVHSWSHELDPEAHDTPQGTCAHRIALDDGGLYEIAPHESEDHLVKTRVLRCQRSTPFRREDGRWARRDEYTIPCPHGDHSFTRDWEPEGTRHTPETPEHQRTAKDPIGWRLRPLSRADDLAAWYNQDDVDHFQPGLDKPFSAVHGRRNDAESFNEWYQQSLQHHGRATSLSPAAQELDFLMGALVNNSNTWQTHLQ